jgi:hypothetical protein
MWKGEIIQDTYRYLSPGASEWSEFLATQRICTVSPPPPFFFNLRPTVSRPVSGAHPRPVTNFSFSLKFPMLPLGGLHGKHAVQSGIWVP